MLTRPDKMKLHTLIGNYPNAMPMKDGRVKSDLIEFDFPDFPVPNRGFKPMVREHKFDCGELATAFDRPLTGASIPGQGGKFCTEAETAARAEARQKEAALAEREAALATAQESERAASEQLFLSLLNQARAGRFSPAA